MSTEGCGVRCGNSLENSSFLQHIIPGEVSSSDLIWGRVELSGGGSYVHLSPIASEIAHQHTNDHRKELCGHRPHQQTLPNLDTIHSALEIV
jgi:hypothetical protein